MNAARADFWLACPSCRERFALGPLVFGCPACRRSGRLSVLEVGLRPAAAPAAPAVRRGPAGLARYADLLPGAPAGERVTLGEGGTPLVRSRVLGPRLGLARLYFKNDTANPTWSFKDRYTAVTIDVARSLGFRRAVVSSTGNLGVSAAAYCAAAGLECLFLAPADAPRPILDQARLHGARVLVTTWDGRQPVFEHLATNRGWFPVGLFLARAVNNPFGVEGYKTIAYEILEALGDAPRAVLFPCARGNGLFGAYKGFREAVSFGWTGRVPAMVACQPVGANSLEVSLERRAAEAIELPPADSVAFSTKERVADTRALEAIRASSGTALSATDAEILAAVQDLGREGLFVEPSAALPVACLPRLVASGLVGPDDAVVCLLTAAGIKWPDAAGQWAEPDTVEPDLEQLDRYLAR
jgi:threonine synthase